jgi:hypothetical protein
LDSDQESQQNGLYHRVSRFRRRIEKPKLHINNEVICTEILPKENKDDELFTVLYFNSDINSCLVKSVRVCVDSILNEGKKDFNLSSYPEKITADNYELYFSKLKSGVNRKVIISKSVGKPEELIIETNYTEKDENVTEILKYTLVAEVEIEGTKSYWYGINYKTPNVWRKTKSRKENTSSSNLPIGSQTA